jgi:hypothetical protein
LACCHDFDLILALFVVKAQDLYWFPAIFMALVYWRKGMGLAWLRLAILDPLLNRPVFIPCIISGENFDTWHVSLIEDLIFLVKKCDCVSSGLILINTSLCPV